MGQRRRRLSKSAEFDRVYRQGRSAGGRFFVMYAFERSDVSDVEDGHPTEDSKREPRLGVSVGRRVGNAAERNEVKRLVREAFWGMAEDLPSDHDYVIVGRPGSSELAGRERLAGTERELRELVGELGLTAGEVSSS